MGKVIIQEETTLIPITLIGKEAGLCWGANTEDNEKNYNRGIECLKAGHFRTAEFPQVYMILDGYSARVIRELYTHIGGSPTRLQASTRYINYADFDYIVPPKIAANEQVKNIYDRVMRNIQNYLEVLNQLGVPKEDSANLLPLGMTTKMVLRTNLRNLIDMSHQRMCTRAYWEFRELMQNMVAALSNYSEEWKYLTEQYFKAKCDVSGYCTETRSCGRYPKIDI